MNLECDDKMSLQKAQLRSEETPHQQSQPGIVIFHLPGKELVTIYLLDSVPLFICSV
jgi:hypothetical protein